MALYDLKEAASLSIDTQGDTGTPSRIKILGERNGEAITDQFSVRMRICNDGTFANSTNATMAVDTGFGTLLKTNTANKDLEFRSASTKATGVLTISGVVVDGETVTIGGRVYEFDNDGSWTQGNVLVDITARATASQGTLTMDTQPAALDALEINGKTYVWVASGTADADGEISRGASLAAAKTNFVAAINGTDGVNTAHPDVTAAAFSGDDCVITAIVAGAGGDAITTTESFTAGTNVFDAATLGTTTAGVECSAANAVTDLVAAITDDGDAVVTAADGTGNTVDLTAIVAGYAGDAIATTETMANGSFGAATLSGAAIPSEIFVNVTDASAETITIRLGQPDFDGLNCEYHTAHMQLTHAAP